MNKGTVDPSTIRVWIEQVQLYSEFFSITILGPSYLWVLYPQLQPTADQNQYFHIPNHRFLTADRKYYFWITPGGIHRCKGLTIKSEVIQELSNNEGQWPQPPALFKSRLYFEEGNENLALSHFDPVNTVLSILKNTNFDFIKYI